MSRLKARLLLPIEREKYQELMERFHYLGAAKSHLSAALRYVVENAKGEWLALMDWGYGALKNGPRDRYLEWDGDAKERLLRYVVTNTRFLILPWGRSGVKHLATQALALVTKRISNDWAVYHGHHVFLAETFVDPSRFKGTCYRAANWIHVGQTRGFGRSDERYFEHGQKKDVFVFPLHRATKRILSVKGFPHPLLGIRGEEDKVMVDLNSISEEGVKGLAALFSQIPDQRDRQGLRYKQPALLALSVCAILSGATSFQAISDFGKQLSHELRKKLGFRPFNMPTEPVIRYTLNAIDTREFDKLASEWILKYLPRLRGRALAVDGKTMRAARTAEGKSPHLLSAVLHHDGFVVAQHQVPDKTNEIPEVRRLLEPLDIRGATVTVDALHTQTDTADFIVEHKNADYLMTVKKNQKDLYESLASLPDEAFSPKALHVQQRARKS